MNNGDFDYYNQPSGQEEQQAYQSARDPAEDISGVVDSLSKPRTMLYSVLSLVCGFAALVLGCCGGWFGLVIGALAIAFSIISRRHLGYFDMKSIVGLVLGIVGAVFGIAFIVLGALIDSAIVDEPPFSVREGGIIRPGFHEEADRLRDLLAGMGIVLKDHLIFADDDFVSIGESDPRYRNALFDIT